MEEENKPTQEDLLKAVGDVLDQAIAEYERLAKMGGMGIDAAQSVDDMKGQGKGVVGEGEGQKPLMAKEEDKKEDDKDDKKDKDEDDDEKLMSAYKSLVAKMEKRGLMKKTEPCSQNVQKSETAPAKETESEELVVELRKSVDDRFESLTKAIKDVAETVKKIASTPMPRKGVATGVKPLKKTEGAEENTLSKSDVLNKLLDLKKNGDQRVDSSLIFRVESGKANQADITRIRSLGIGE